MKKENIDYFFEVYEKTTIPEIFSSIILGKGGIIFNNPNYNVTVEKDSKKIYSIFFIPDYLKPSFNHAVFSRKKVSQFFKGYAILLKDFESADSYIKYRFRSNAKGIRRRVKRLESCFRISYKTFYGTIQKEEYEFLMNSLKEMLIRRFEQRNDVSQSLIQWERYQEMYFSLINQQKASLFVILENDIPIVVSLNHHFQGKLFSAISSYDIDYAKFSLGSVEIYKKLDWCIANNHDSYEMGMGDLSYKREWCNHVYNFEHQIIYPKKSFIARLLATKEYAKVSFKEFVFKVAYVRYKNYKASRKKIIDPEVVFKAEAIEDSKPDLHYPLIDHNAKEYIFIRKAAFDFLYSAVEHISNLKIFEVSKEEKTYIIAGTTKMQKVIF